MHVDALHAALEYFENMIDTAYDYAEAHIQKGGKIAGIMCEYTPREIFLAADVLPVCLCGGSLEMIAPAEAELPSNLCPLIKSTYGYHKTHENPFLEWASLIVAETTCDGKKKMYELLARERPMHVLELPQKPDDPDALTHWRCEIDKLILVLEKLTGTPLTDEKLRSAVRLMNRERSARLALAECMQQKAPPLTGAQLLEFKSILSGIPADIEAYETLLAALRAHPEPVEQKDDPRVRVLLTGVPTPHGAERVVHLIEESGGLIVAQENCSGIKPLIENIDPDAPDIRQAIAEHYLHLPCSVMTPNQKRMDTIQTLCHKYHVQAVIDLCWQSCLTYDIESHFLRNVCNDTLHVPYLKILTDYSPSDSERLRTRIEALFEMCRDV